MSYNLPESMRKELTAYAGIRSDGATVVFVAAPDGDHATGTGSGTVADPYRGIQTALDVLIATPFDATDLLTFTRTLVIAGGYYNEDLHITGNGIYFLAAQAPVVIANIDWANTPDWAGPYAPYAILGQRNVRWTVDPLDPGLRMLWFGPLVRILETTQFWNVGLRHEPEDYINWFTSGFTILGDIQLQTLNTAPPGGMGDQLGLRASSVMNIEEYGTYEGDLAIALKFAGVEAIDMPAGVTKLAIRAEDSTILSVACPKVWVPGPGVSSSVSGHRCHFYNGILFPAANGRFHQCSLAGDLTLHTLGDVFQSNMDMDTFTLAAGGARAFETFMRSAAWSVPDHFIDIDIPTCSMSDFSGMGPGVPPVKVSVLTNITPS